VKELSSDQIRKATRDWHDLERLTPGFSPVTEPVREKNRFNGLPGAGDQSALVGSSRRTAAHSAGAPRAKDAENRTADTR
jgi:hypothetical protein